MASAMATAEIQSLLRFLSQDAKLPLASAMGKVMDLQKANLISYENHLSLSIRCSYLTFE